MSDYEVRIGTTVRAEPVGSYNELLGQPTAYAEDDGALAGPWLANGRSGPSWNEGRCPCGGTLCWAEAGYAPWHRVCDRCGSHWEMRPVTLFTSRGRPAGERIAGYRLPDGAVVRGIDEVWLRGYGEDDVTLVIERVPAVPPAVLPLASRQPGDYNDLRDGHQLVNEDDLPMVRAVWELVQPEHLTDEVLRHGAVYGGWARRARFY